jgi:hypothetical protein
MSNLDTAPTVSRARRTVQKSKIRRPKIDLPKIEIEDEIWQARRDFAAAIGVCDTTVKRFNLRTVLIGGVAYVPVAEGLREIAGKASRRLEAPAMAARPVRRRHSSLHR